MALVTSANRPLRVVVIGGSPGGLYAAVLLKRLDPVRKVTVVVRAVWPAERPMAVRISATDWAEGGTTGVDAVRIAEAFAEHGAHAIDVSTGQVVAHERPDLAPVSYL